MADETPRNSAPDLGGAANQVRDAAKWLIASFAGLGGVLVAGSQLSSLGSLPVGDLRFGIALVGVVGALTAIVVAIEKTTDVLVLDPLSLQSLVAASGGELLAVKQRLESDSALVPEGDLDKLYREYTTAVERQRSSYDTFRAAHAEVPAVRKVLRELAELEDGNARTKSSIVQNVMAVARMLQVSDAFRRAKPWILGMTGVAALGIVAFAAAANPSEEDASKSGSQPTVITKGGRVTVELTQAGRSVLGSRLGARCEMDALPAMALGAGTGGIDVLTLPSKNCESLRFSMPTRLGSIR